MNAFADKTVAITGAASGIGRALAVKLAARGARVGLSDLNGDAVLAVRDEIRAAAGQAEARAVDVARMEQVQSWADEVEKALGPIDLLVNNAGVTLMDLVLTQSLEDMYWIMNINFWGVVHGVRAVLPGMRARGRGHIVNISSLFGLLGVPGQSAYNASKFAVRGFTEALGHEERPHGIDVTCVHPGGIKTAIAKNARFRHDPRGGTNPEKFVAIFEKIAKTTAEEAADIILKGVQARRKRILIGPDARLIDKIQRLFPEEYYAVLQKMGLF